MPNVTFCGYFGFTIALSTGRSLERSILQTKKYYGTGPNVTRILDNVNISVEQGEFVAIVGTSGLGC